MWPSAHYKDVGVRIASFRSSIAHPAYSPVYASLTPWRESAQDSGPSGSLVLSRRVSSTPASYRFIPALSVMAIFQQLPHWAWGTVTKVTLPLETLPKQHNSDAAITGESTWFT